MAKRSAESDGFKGYLHNVSGISSSAAGKTRYFVGQLQMSKTDVKKVVVFSPEKHDTYMKASGLQSPVKITGGKLSPGKNEQLDILVGKGATLEVLTEPLMFKKQKIETSAMSEPKNLDALNKEGLNATIYVKILKLEEKKTVNTRYGTKFIRNGICADNTATRRMTLWQNQIEDVKENTFYKITNISTNLFNQNVWVNTTAATKVTEIENFGDVIEDPAVMTNEQITITLNQIAITCQTRCSNSSCLKCIQPTTDSTIRCPECKMKQLAKNLQTNITGTLKTDGPTLTLHQPQIENFLTAENKIHLMSDIDRLEDYLLEITKFQVEHSDNYIKSIKRTVQNE